MKISGIKPGKSCGTVPPSSQQACLNNFVMEQQDKDNGNAVGKRAPCRAVLPAKTQQCLNDYVMWIQSGRPILTSSAKSTINTTSTSMISQTIIRNVTRQSPKPPTKQDPTNVTGQMPRLTNKKNITSRSPQPGMMLPHSLEYTLSTKSFD